VIGRDGSVEEVKDWLGTVEGGKFKCAESCGLNGKQLYFLSLKFLSRNLFKRSQLSEMQQQDYASHLFSILHAFRPTEKQKKRSQILKQILRMRMNDPSLTRFKGEEMDEESWKCLFHALSSNTTLTHLTLRNYGSSEGQGNNKFGIGEIIQQTSSLRFLELKEMDKVCVSPKSVAKAIENNCSSLTHLHISCLVRKWKAIHEAIGKCAKTLKFLSLSDESERSTTYFSFFRENEKVESLTLCSSLTHLNLCDHIRGSKVDFIGDIIKHNTDLTFLDLARNSFKLGPKEDFVKVGRRLSVLTSLTHLSISSQIISKGEIIEKAIGNLTNLTYLNLNLPYSFPSIEQRSLECFSKLKNLIGLDSCFESSLPHITTSALTNLNISSFSPYFSARLIKKNNEKWKEKIKWSFLMNWIGRVFFSGECWKLPPEILFHILSSLPLDNILSEKEKIRIIQHASDLSTLETSEPREYVIFVFEGPGRVVWNELYHNRKSSTGILDLSAKSFV